MEVRFPRSPQRARVTHLAGRLLELTVALRLLPRPVMPSRVPIALLMTSFEPGGTERQMTELIRRLDRSRFEVHVAALHRRGAWPLRGGGSAAATAEPSTPGAG